MSYPVNLNPEICLNMLFTLKTQKPLQNQTNKRINASALASMGRSRGVALLTAMLITALVAVAAVSMAERQQLDIRRTENLMHGDQAMIYAFTAESIVSDLLLLQDSKNSNTFEELELANTALAVVAASIPIQGGGIAFKLSDLSGSFPLNRVVKDGNKDSLYYGGLGRLLRELEWYDEENNKNIAVKPEMASYIVDWIDANSQQDNPGAEDSVYLSRTVPYRTANQPFVSLTELRLMAEMTNDEYNLLAAPVDGSAPKVNVLPADAVININTASKEVIMSLHSSITNTIADDIISARDSGDSSATAVVATTGITDKNEIIKIIKKTLKTKKEKDDFKNTKMLDYDIISSYFQLTTTVTVGRSEIRLISVLKRDQAAKKVETIRRGIGVL